MNGYNFTERVRVALAGAREEAARLHHHYVGTEHELLGLLRDDESLATAIIRSFDVDPAALVAAVEDSVKKGASGDTIGPDLPYTSRAKKVLEFSMAEARSLHHNYVGTEHLLLGLLREDKGIAALVLKDAGITIDPARQRLVEILRESSPEAPAPAPGVRRRPVSPPGPPSAASAAMAASIVELLAQDDAVGAVFAAQGIDVAKLAAALRSLAVPPSPGASDTAA